MAADYITLKLIFAGSKQDQMKLIPAGFTGEFQHSPFFQQNYFGPENGGHETRRDLWQRNGLVRVLPNTFPLWSGSAHTKLAETHVGRRRLR